MKKIYKETKIIIMSLQKYIRDEDWGSRKIYSLENIIQVEKIDDEYLVFEYSSGDTLDGLTKIESISQVDKLTVKLQRQEKLLELYKLHYKYVPFMPGLGDKADIVIETVKKIRELENSE